MDRIAESINIGNELLPLEGVTAQCNAGTCPGANCPKAAAQKK
jgi:hypothetical protein